MVCFVTNLEIQTTEKGSYCVITLKGRIDAFSDRRLLKALKPISETTRRWIALDLSQVEFLSLWALKEIHNWSLEMRLEQRRLVLLSVPALILKQIAVFLPPPQFDTYLTFEELELKSFYEAHRSMNLQPRYEVPLN